MNNSEKDYIAGVILLHFHFENGLLFAAKKKFKRDIANFMHSKLFIIILLSNKKENLEIG